jgi:hypothetical protein
VPLRAVWWLRFQAAAPHLEMHFCSSFRLLQRFGISVVPACKILILGNQLARFVGAPLWVPCRCGVRLQAPCARGTHKGCPCEAHWLIVQTRLGSKNQTGSAQKLKKDRVTLRQVEHGNGGPGR